MPDTHDLIRIMYACSRDLKSDELRRELGQCLLTVFKADFFVSYVWNPKTHSFSNRVQLNMSDTNLDRYETEHSAQDPIINALSRRVHATAVSEVMAHDQLRRTPFFNDFLARDGLHYGMNYFARDQGRHVGDLRIWRNRRREDFSRSDVRLLDQLAPAMVNALSRSNRQDDQLLSKALAGVCARYRLTIREAEIAEQIFSGRSDRDICDFLNVAKPTLRSHVAAIFRKCNISRRAQIAPLVLQHHHL